MNRIVYGATFCFCLVCLACCFISAQPTYQKTMPSLLNQTLIEKSNDDQFLFVAGILNKNGASVIEVNKLQADDGKIIWQKTYDGHFSNPGLRDIIVHDDGLLLAISDESATKSNAFIYKFDMNGNTQWLRQIGIQNRTQIFDIEQDNNNRIWIAGLQIPGSALDTAAFFITQMYADGHLSEAIKLQYRLWIFHISDDIHKAHRLTWMPDLNKMYANIDCSSPYTIPGIYKDNNGGLSTFPAKNEYIAAFDSLNFMNITELFANVQYMKRASSGRFLVSYYRPDYIKKDTFATLAYFDVKKGLLTYAKKTVNALKIIGTHNENVFVYDDEQHILLKLDSTLNTIWKIKIDRCQQTNNFNAVVNNQGEIFAVRNTGAKTICAKINNEGLITQCPTVNIDDDSYSYLNEENTYLFNIGGKILSYKIQLNLSDSELKVEQKSATSSDLCSATDARFLLPDTICLGDTVFPLPLDTSSNVKHIWQTPDKGYDEAMPAIIFNTIGAFNVEHYTRIVGCADSFSQKIIVIDKPLSLIHDTLICAKDSLLLHLGYQKNAEYFLNEIKTSGEILIKTSGDYKLKIKIGGCEIISNVKVKLNDFELPSIIQDTALCDDLPFRAYLNNHFTDIVWDDKYLQDTFIVYDSEKHTFKGKYSKDKECNFSGFFNVDRKKCTHQNVFFPNVFSPNGDNFNDTFIAEVKNNTELISLKIYNRWGNMVFNSVHFDSGWNGEFNNVSCPQDVYVYSVVYRNTLSNETIVSGGELLLLR